MPTLSLSLQTCYDAYSLTRNILRGLHGGFVGENRVACAHRLSFRLRLLGPIHLHVSLFAIDNECNVSLHRNGYCMVEFIWISC